ncbi:MAG: GIY-YIG nuclease family protein [Chitinophagaceae bacterium]
MIEVYAIVSESSRENYVGMTLDAQRRLKEHNNRRNRYTKSLRPWKLFRIEYFHDWNEARQREKYLKSGVGKEFLKSMVP